MPFCKLSSKVNGFLCWNLLTNVSLFLISFLAIFFLSFCVLEDLSPAFCNASFIGVLVDRSSVAIPKLRLDCFAHLRRDDVIDWTKICFDQDWSQRSSCAANDEFL